MSNGAFVWTLEQTATGFAQFSKAMQLVREGQRPPERVSPALQAIIGDDDIIVVPKVASTPTGKVFHVVGNFNSVAEAIDAGKYPLKWDMAEKPEETPAIIQPVDSFVRLVPLGHMTTAGDIYTGFTRMVDPMTAFTFGAWFPEEQRASSYITLWKNTEGELWYVYLGVDGRRRGVGVNQIDPADEFCPACCVLVREFSPPQAEK